MKKDSFGDRMKAYEKANEVIHDTSVPMIVRLDGRGFSRYTAKKKFNRPVDWNLSLAMEVTSDCFIYLRQHTIPRIVAILFYLLHSYFLAI